MLYFKNWCETLNVHAANSEIKHDGGSGADAAHVSLNSHYGVHMALVFKITTLFS